MRRGLWHVSDFTAYIYPVLAVPFPDCGTRAGAWCIRLSGDKAMDLHMARTAAADRLFIEQHGPDASIERVGDSWAIDPRGRVGIRPQPEQLALFRACTQ